ncbi:MAG: putative repeat protein (TIGR01451 family), partial [Myxococcota bacterium]
MSRWVCLTVALASLAPALASAGSAPHDEIFDAGSLIIPMDTDYQDAGMLKAYGLVYALLKADIPVAWVVKEGKETFDEADFTTGAIDFASGATIPEHGYRGGPFIVDLSDAAAAGAVITQWQASHTTTVHAITSPFTGYVVKELVLAPSIGILGDGNEHVAFGYLNAAGIPDSLGQTWPKKKQGNYSGFPDVLTVDQVAGTSGNTSDGALFDDDGNPIYCQLMTMHWKVDDVDDDAVAEMRSFLTHPTHLMAECQAVNAIENSTNGHFLTTNGFDIDSQPGAVQFFHSNFAFAQVDGAFTTVGGSEPSYSLASGSSYHDTDIVMVTAADSGPGTRDVWMTGYLDGLCTMVAGTQGDCPAGVGKISYLGGHKYEVQVPISSNPKSQGARLFINSLFEADCATDAGQPTFSFVTSAPNKTLVPTLTYTIVLANSGPGTALSAVLSDPLPAGAVFVSATGGGSYDEPSHTVTWNLGNLGKTESLTRQVEVLLTAPGQYTNKAQLSYVVGLNQLSATSLGATTVYQVDTDGDGLLDDDELDVSGADGKAWTADDFLTDPYNADTDGDGLKDGEELDASDLDGLPGTADNFATDPTSADSDSDTLPDGKELAVSNADLVAWTADDFALDPTAIDTDQDGWSDPVELQCGTDPSSSLSVPTDLDNDGGCDVLDACVDVDGDGYGEGLSCTGPDCDDTAPLCTIDCADTDLDGQADCSEGCVDADGDGYGVGPACIGLDCNEGIAACTTVCSDADSDGLDDCDDGCLDTDGDGYGDGPDCIAQDCNDLAPKCTLDCADVDLDGKPDCADGCVDNDGDGFGDGPDCVGVDCDDLTASCTLVCEDVDNDQVVDCLDPCVDVDQDGLGVGPECSGPDCDDSQAACGADCSVDADGDALPDCADTCIDVDQDGAGQGPGCPDDCNDLSPVCTDDCTDANEDGIADCAADCVDLDGDGFGEGTACIGPDCNDLNPSCAQDCIDEDEDGAPDCGEACVDADGDGYGVGPDCIAIDCDDTAGTCTTSCVDLDDDGIADCADTCLDLDKDGYGVGPDCLGADCNDLSPACTDDCSDADNDQLDDCSEDCIDVDGDGYGAGPACIGSDCDDDSVLCAQDCADLDDDKTADCQDPCVDIDEDGYGLGNACLGPDCDDQVATCTIACIDTDKDEINDCEDPCVDTDQDGHGVGPECLDEDCDDWSAACALSCVDLDQDGIQDCEDPCIDKDQDGLGAGCVLPDCDDTAP